MYLGNVMELATKEHLYHEPLHPYSQALLSAVPLADPNSEKQKKVQLLDGDLPSPLNPPQGCVFSSRCPKANSSCTKSRPELKTARDKTLVACFKVKG
jgi:oligopeptide transport system ATP-binding protein